MDLIVAVDKHLGMGYRNALPWHCAEELKLFRTKTMGSVLVMGYNTVMNIPHLPGRQIYCITKPLPTKPMDLTNDVIFIENINEFTCSSKMFVAGGKRTYEQILPRVDTIHLSRLKAHYVCDTFFESSWLDNFVVVEETHHEEFTHQVLKRTRHGERQYLDLIGKILTDGETTVGRNGPTRSLFVEHMTWDLRQGFPLLTTKKMFLRGIVEEFLFFIRGDTDAKILSDKRINIWNGNTSREFIDSRNLSYAEGITGPMYVYQWRRFGAPYTIGDDNRPLPPIPGVGVDQLAQVIDLIKNDPTSRRILLTTYNPAQADEGVLYPCHSITVQFSVRNNYLDMFCFNRSQDTFLGVPYNIASSALLLMSVAKLSGTIPRYLNMTMGDTHLYSSHLENAKEQMERVPYKLPTLIIPEMDSLEDLERVSFVDFKLEKYIAHPTIKATMVV